MWADIVCSLRELPESEGIIHDVRRCLLDRTNSWVRHQIGAEVTVERRPCSHVGRREPEADVAIGADHDHTARREARADGIEAGVVRDLHELGPA